MKRQIKAEPFNYYYGERVVITILDDTSAYIGLVVELNYMEVRDLITQLLHAMGDEPLSKQLQDERTQVLADAKNFMRDGLRRRGYDMPDKTSLTDVLSLVDRLVKRANDET